MISYESCAQKSVNLSFIEKKGFEGHDFEKSPLGKLNLDGRQMGIYQYVYGVRRSLIVHLKTQNIVNLH